MVRFESADGLGGAVSSDDHVQFVSEVGCLFEVVFMSGVKMVKGAERENAGFFRFGH